MFMRHVWITFGFWLILGFPQPAHAEGPFSWEGGYGSVSFKVGAVRQGDLSVVTIKREGLSVMNEPLVREMKGVVERAEVADLNADHAKSANDSPATSEIGFSVNNGKGGPIRTHPSVLMNTARRLQHGTLDRQAKSGDLAVNRHATV